MPPAWQIGQRVRASRLALGLTQQQLAGQLGVTPQQIGRYESGADQMSAVRLNEIAKVLEVSPGSLFPPHGSGGEQTNVNGVVSADEFSMLLKPPNSIKLLQWNYMLDGLHRHQLSAFAKTLANASSPKRTR
jgi:transcriptional regulator with XRE-family HTH domain